MDKTSRLPLHLLLSRVGLWTREQRLSLASSLAWDAAQL